MNIEKMTVISQREAYRLMLKDYPDVMNIEQMCEILSVSTKTGYKLLKGGTSLPDSQGASFHIPVYRKSTAYLSAGGIAKSRATSFHSNPDCNTMYSGQR